MGTFGQIDFDQFEIGADEGQEQPGAMGVTGERVIVELHGFGPLRLVGSAAVGHTEQGEEWGESPAGRSLEHNK